MLARLVHDKGTKKLKGTAFVEFEQQADAQAAADACAKARCAASSLPTLHLPKAIALAACQMVKFSSARFGTC